MEEPSDALMEFALFALDHATASVVPEGGPLVPFSLIDGADGRSLARYLGEMEAGQQHAREAVQATDEAQLAAVAWDGYLTVEDQRFDAVFVEASERGDSESVILAQRYSLRGRLRKKAAAVGNAALVGRGTSLFGE